MRAPRRAEDLPPGAAGATAGQARSPERPVRIPVPGATLHGDLSLPEGTEALVVFVHGSGSSRFSVRNRFVAAELQRAGIGTLLMDLLTADEEAVDLRTRGFRFDIPLLAERVVATIDHLRTLPEAGLLRLGLFGASTGAAAALIAAGERPVDVRAVVSRGGRPDLAGGALGAVRAPTLLIVGGWDADVLVLNEDAKTAMTAAVQLAVIPEASHLFEEPGKLEEVARLATGFFRRHLVSA